MPRNGGNHHSEWVATMARNRWQLCPGICIRTSRSLTFTKDLGDISATMEHGPFKMCSIFRIADGMISEQWLVLDNVTEQKILGVYGER